MYLLLYVDTRRFIEGQGGLLIRVETEFKNVKEQKFKGYVNIDRVIDLLIEYRSSRVIEVYRNIYR